MDQLRRKLLEHALPALWLSCLLQEEGPSGDGCSVCCCLGFHGGHQHFCRLRCVRAESESRGSRVIALYASWLSWESSDGWMLHLPDILSAVLILNATQECGRQTWAAI